MKPEIDPHSGQETTGHEWNGIKELNHPIPRVFSLWLWASILCAAILWVLYPSFPGYHQVLGGVLGYSPRGAVNDAVTKGQEQRAEAYAKFTKEDYETLLNDPALQAIYQDEIGVLFRDNCAACHGRNGDGQSGFPNLRDDHWLWAADPEEIQYTLQVGINADHEDTRMAEMPAFGRDEWLEQADIDHVIEYVLQISSQPHNAEMAHLGKTVFEENCAGCHGDAGHGGYENGAPSLTDTAWIYGSSRADIADTLYNGRRGVMPAWSGRLSEREIRQITMYLLWWAE